MHLLHNWVSLNLQYLWILYMKSIISCNLYQKIGNVYWQQDAFIYHLSFRNQIPGMRNRYIWFTFLLNILYRSNAIRNVDLHVEYPMQLSKDLLEHSYMYVVYRMEYVWRDLYHNHQNGLNPLQQLDTNLIWTHCTMVTQ